MAKLGEIIAGEIGFFYRVTRKACWGLTHRKMRYCGKVYWSKTEDGSIVGGS